MKRSRSLISLIALGCATSALACDPPAAVVIPPGDEATLEQMQAAQAGVQEFIAAMDEYLTCIDGEIEALGEDATQEDHDGLVERYNEGVTQMEEVAADFNEQRQLYLDTAAAAGN